MSLSLSDLRAAPPKGRGRCNYRLSLRGDLVAQVQALVEELQDLEVQPTADDDGNPTGPPRRMGEGGPDPRVEAIQARLADLQPAIEDHTGDLVLEAISDGDWRLWVDAHPPRDPKTTAGQRDRIVDGLCDLDALIDDLGRWAHSWNGDPLAVTDWAEVFAGSIAGGDLRGLARAVVGLQEGTTNLPKSLSGLLAGLRSVNGSN